MRWVILTYVCEASFWELVLFSLIHSTVYNVDNFYTSSEFYFSSCLLLLLLWKKNEQNLSIVWLPTDFSHSIVWHCHPTLVCASMLNFVICRLLIELSTENLFSLKAYCTRTHTDTYTVRIWKKKAKSNSLIDILKWQTNGSSHFCI